MYPSDYLLRRIKECFASEKGTALLEFSIVFPVLILLAFGVIEVVRALLITQKVEKAVMLVNNITTQYVLPSHSSSGPPISASALSTLMNEVPVMLIPYASNPRIIILSDVTTGPGNVPKVNWQYCGGGTLSQASKIGKAGGKAKLAGFTTYPNEEYVIGEIYYQYTPLIMKVIAPMTIYRRTFFVPRFDTLSAFTSHCS